MAIHAWTLAAAVGGRQQREYDGRMLAGDHLWKRRKE
jgi:hypothetical protein